MLFNAYTGPILCAGHLTYIRRWLFLFVAHQSKHTAHEFRMKAILPSTDHQINQNNTNFYATLISACKQTHRARLHETALCVGPSDWQDKFWVLFYSISGTRNIVRIINRGSYFINSFFFNLLATLIKFPKRTDYGRFTAHHERERRHNTNGIHKCCLAPVSWPYFGPEYRPKRYR